MSSDICDDCAEFAYRCDVAEQRVREQAERIKALEAVAELVVAINKEDDIHTVIILQAEQDKALQAAGYGETGK